jgi:septum formation inhibitor MinC
MRCHDDGNERERSKFVSEDQARSRYGNRPKQEEVQQICRKNRDTVNQAEILRSGKRAYEQGGELIPEKLI